MLFDIVMGWNIFVHADYTRGECADAFVCLFVCRNVHDNAGNRNL